MISKKWKFFILLVVFFVPVFIGLSLSLGMALPLFAQTDAISQREAQLRAELDKVLQEIAAQQAILRDEQAKGATFKGDIAILNAQIKKAQLNIRAKEIAIQALGKDINQKTQTINDLNTKIAKNKESLAQLIRRTAMTDELSLVEVILGQGNLSDFFTELNEYDSLKVAVKISSDEIRTDKATNEKEKDSLNKKRNQEIDQKISIEDEEKKIKVAQAEKQRLLNLSVAQQQNYQSVIKSREQQAAQIRAALFALRDTAAIPFGKALEYANEASAKTGVRPAFILAILTQESNLGKNTGSCFLTNAATGAGAGANTGTPFSNVMHPTRDVPIFVSMMQAIGRDPYATKVSCPQSIGWGGAMGPAQFIPSTWKLMEASIASAVGVSTPDPWNPEHAFMASALYLRNLGANAGSYTSEMDAACKYYSGRACNLGPGAGYGASVMAKAADIQTNMIDPLEGR